MSDATRSTEELKPWAQAVADMTKRRPTDSERLTRVLPGWLSQRRPGATGIEIADLVIPSATGNSNETVIFRASWREDGHAREGRFVLRIEPASPPLFPQQTCAPLPSVEIQYRAMQVVAEDGNVPLAPLIGYEANPAVLGRPFFVMVYVDGQVPSDVPPYPLTGFLFDEATPAQRRRLVESGLDVLARIHRIDWRKADVGLLVPQGRAPGLRWQLDLYTQYVRQELRGRAHPILEPGLAWLDEHFPGEGEVALSWGDARIGNMIFAGYECAAVTDWEAVALGPPELDLGWWLSQDRAVHETYSASRLEGLPTREEQQAYYAAVSGRRLGDLHYFEAFAAMRYTAVMIRLGDRMAQSGRVPAEMNMAVHNVATQLLADVLDIPYCWTDPPH
jgi:aminoglycoside phosphotransferase (APT) family kinase protein